MKKLVLIFLICFCVFNIYSQTAQTNVIDPNETIFNRAMEYMDEDNFERAIELLNSITDSERFSVLYNLGVCHFMMGLTYDEKQDANNAIASFTEARRYFEACDKIDSGEFYVINCLIRIRYKLGELKDIDELTNRLRRIRTASTDPRLTRLQRFTIDSFFFKDFYIVVQESFVLSGTLYYHWVFNIYDSEGDFIKSVNLESSAGLRSLGFDYVVGTDQYENNRRIHQTTTVMFRTLPDYETMKNILIEEIENGLEVGATGVYPIR
ncbi:MAG: hypothetical protein FWD28_01935 [Treponema sp.]|nr:hypothetical protein [Treponema sp.]